LTSLRTRLGIIIAIIGLIPLVVLSVLVYNLSYNTILEKTQNQLASEAFQRANAIASVNQLRIQQLESFAASNEIQSIMNEYDTTHFNKTVGDNILKEMRNNIMQEWVGFHNATGGEESGFSDIIITDKKGIVVFAYNESLNGKDFSEDKIFTDGLTKSYRIPELEEGKRSVGTVVPIMDESKRHADALGVIMADTGTFFIDRILLNREGLGNTGESYLVNSDKILITPSRFIDGIFKQKVDTFPVRECFEHGRSVSGNYVQQAKVSAREYYQGKGSAVYKDYRGVPVFGTSFCARDLGYVLLVEIDQQEVLASLVILQQEYIAIILITITAISITIIGSTRYVIRPLKELRNAIDDMTLGNFNVKTDVSSTDEIGELATRFRKMSKHVKSVNDNLQNLIKERTSELGELNKELVENQIRIAHHMREVSKTKAALDEASIVAITDKNGTITDVNQKFCDISKYSRDELIGQNHRILKSGYHPPEFYQGMWKTISSGKIWKGDIKNMAKDGTFYWVRSTIMPILDHQRNPIEYIAVRTDITNQKRVEDELRRALDELREADILKDEFGSMISHELRTPLIPIMGYCEMLMDPNLDIGLKESQVESIREIHKNSKKLLKMINDILTVQKLEMRQIKFEKKDTSLIPFMEIIVNSYTPAMKEKMIEFTNTTSVDHTIKTDPDRLEQVFGNLIQNAIDFVPFNGMIEIGAKSEGDSIVFYVKDNGFGIPKEKQNDLFSRFYQVDTSMKRKHGGTGLGLAICKELVEGLGGKIEVESDEGKGTTFYFTVPKE